MEIEIRQVAYSKNALKDLEELYSYGIITFSYSSATVFVDELHAKISALSSRYLHYPECRYLKTKSKKYRNLRFGSYLVIYRVTPQRVEILNILHSSRSIAQIKAARRIKLD